MTIKQWFYVKFLGMSVQDYNCMIICKYLDKIGL
jgi:hypothetical protein